MTAFLSWWTFSVPLFFTVVFKRHVYKLRYIFPIPYKECTENVKLFIVTWGYHFEHELQGWPLPILISDSRIALGVLGCLHHGIVIPSRTHSSPTHTHTHTHLVSLTPSWNPLMKVVVSPPRFLPSSIMSWARSFGLKRLNFYTHILSSSFQLCQFADKCSEAVSGGFLLPLLIIKLKRFSSELVVQKGTKFKQLQKCACRKTDYKRSSF